MRRFRVRIATLLAVIGFVGLSLAALRAADEVWDSVVLGGTLLVLSMAVALGMVLEGRSRAFWVGFAVFGWVALGASLVPGVAERLPTTKGLAWVDSVRQPRGVVELMVDGRRIVNITPEIPYADVVSALNAACGSNSASVGAVADMDADGQPAIVTSARGAMGHLLLATRGTSEEFVRIGHSLLAVVIGFIGGTVSVWMWARRRESSA